MKTYGSFSSAWLTELSDVRALGEPSSPRGMATVERRWHQFAVADPLSFPVQVPGRKFRDVIGVLEALSLVGQVSVPEAFTDRVKNFANFTDSGVFHGAYGIRAFGHLGDLVDLLTRDPDSRQAVLTIYDSDQDLNRTKRDVPCTLSLQFLQHAGLLDVRVTMRSNDLWLGTPYDFAQFAILQASVAQALGLQPGAYVHTAGSLHLYERNFEEANRALDEGLDPDLSLDARMPFPLWTADADIAAISSRARRMLLDPHSFGDGQPLTAFESWAASLLW